MASGHLKTVVEPTPETSCIHSILIDRKVTKKEMKFTKKRMLMNGNEKKEGEKEGDAYEEEGLFIPESKRVN
jgi:hypothetical protein